MNKKTACLGEKKGMKSYPVMWGLFHKQQYMGIPIEEPGFNGKMSGVPYLCSVTEV